MRHDLFQWETGMITAISSEALKSKRRAAKQMLEKHEEEKYMDRRT